MDTVEMKIYTDIPIEMQKAFVQTVKDEALGKNGVPSYMSAEIGFYARFLEMFTDYKTPYEDINDPELAAAIREALSEHACVRYLKECVQKELELSLSSNKAIENVALLASRALEGVNKVCDILDEAEVLVRDGSILDVIPADKIGGFLGAVLKALNNVSEEGFDE